MSALRPFFRRWFTRRLNRLCNRACAAAYVTQRTLQERYPCPTYSVSYSSIRMGEADFVALPRRPGPNQRSFTMITVGSLAQPYKGVDILIEALDICLRAGFELRLVVVGEGRYRTRLEARVAALHLDHRVRFAGQLPSRERVREELDRADLFVLASRTEGLPKAMVEAMARGLPCIGTTVGGIPELLDPEAMAVPGDASSLAGIIQSVVTNPAWMAAQAAENLAKARMYHEDILRPRRLAFYTCVRDRTAEWAQAQAEGTRRYKAPSLSERPD